MNDNEKVRWVVLSEKCPKCRAKIIGMSLTKELAIKRLQFNLKNHIKTEHTDR